MTEILLVEDNRINQVVATRILAELDVKVDVADNGFEAIEAVKSKKYDLIFMDCQMPEMDGYTATSGIRKLEEAGEINKIPIVALTAHAMPGDKQKCLDAGMDDYLSKPVNEQGFADMLKKWLGDYCSIDTHEVNKKFQFKYINAEDLEKLSELMGDAFQGLMDMYFSNVKDLFKDLQKAVAARNYPEIVRAAHTIKSPSRQIGSIEVAAKAGEIEVLGRQKSNIDDIETKVIILREQIDKANAEINEYLAMKNKVA